MTPTKIPVRSYCPSKAMPLDVGIIHFVGIGGIGMSGIAEVLHNLGYEVAGSDNADNANVKRLRDMGINIAIGQRAENVEHVSVVVKSTAVPMTNPEIQAAREKHIPVVRRSEMLAELTHLRSTIAVAGSHGKTTTTSMVAHVLGGADLDPTVINGGIINAYGTNAKLGTSDWLVAEADESDGTFIKIPAVAGIVTNLDPEHMDHWGDFGTLKDAFKTFLNNLPFYGFAVVCYDHPTVKELTAGVTDRRILGYGIEDEDADLRAVNIRNSADGTIVDISLSERVTGAGEQVVADVLIPVPGTHNVLNAMAAIAVGLELKIEPASIVRSLAEFEGVKRRFTRTGEPNGVLIVDDYAHHPVEIAATLDAAKRVATARNGKVIAVVQPHRYSRLEDLFTEFCECFTQADKVLVTDVYAAGEKPVPGVDKLALAEGVNKRGVEAIALETDDSLAAVLREQAKANDVVVCMGAGNITQWANELPKKLAGDNVATLAG